MRKACKDAKLTCAGLGFEHAAENSSISKSCDSRGVHYLEIGAPVRGQGFKSRAAPPGSGLKIMSREAALV